MAAWASVYEVRRNTKVGWITALINSVVVATALLVPYLQQRVSDHIAFSKDSRIKELILRNMTSNYNTGVHLLNHDWVGDGDSSVQGKVKLSNADRKRFHFRFERYEDEFERSLKSKEDIYRSWASNPTNALLLNTYPDIERSIVTSMRMRIIYVDTYPGITLDDLISTSRSLDNNLDNSLRTARFVLEHNTLEDGGPTGYTYVFSCLDRTFSDECDRPLTYRAQTY